MAEKSDGSEIKRDNHVKSILKAFQIIEELDRWGELSIADLSQALTMDKTTVHRLVNTIKEAGYIVQNPDTKKYSNGIRLFAIGNRIIQKVGVKQVARPYLETLAQETKETINLSMYSGSSIVYVDIIESESAIRAGASVGAELPMYCTGMGKAIMAFLSEESVEEILRNTVFSKRTTKTVPNKEELMGQLKRARENGYAKDEEEFVDGLISFAAPIFDYRNIAIAALSISMPKMRYNAKENKQYYVELVKKTAEALSGEIGYKKIYMNKGQAAESI